MDRNEVVNIEVTLTDSCNCKCSYCFEGCTHEKKAISNPKNEQRLILLITDYCKTFSETQYKLLELTFWGGEPFMNLDFMKKLIEATYQYDFVIYLCYSNGTLIDKYKEFLSAPFIDSIRNRIQIQLSYDGEPHLTLKRGYSKDIVLQVADLLCNANILPTFKATLTYDMIPMLSEIWKSYEELFYRYPLCRVQYAPSLDTTVSDSSAIDVWKKKLIDVAKLEYQFYSKNGIFLFNGFNAKVAAECAKTNRCTLHTDGSIYICHGVPCLTNKKIVKNLSLGNIFSINSLAEVVNSNAEHDIEQCYDASIVDECLQCNAIYCPICHVSNFDENDTVAKSWHTKKSADKNKCKYFLSFSYISRLLRLAILKNMAMQPAN